MTPAPKFEDLAVVAALDVDEPDLQASRVEVVAVVEDCFAARVELGIGLVPPARTREHPALAALEVVAVDPGLLYLLAGVHVEVGPVDEPAPVHLPSTEVVVGLRLR